MYTAGGKGVNCGQERSVTDLIRPGGGNDHLPTPISSYRLFPAFFPLIGGFYIRSS